jgi:hypothetical protein
VPPEHTSAVFILGWGVCGDVATSHGERMKLWLCLEVASAICGNSGMHAPPFGNDLHLKGAQPPVLPNMVLRSFSPSRPTMGLATVQGSLT